MDYSTATHRAGHSIFVYRKSKSFKSAEKLLVINSEETKFCCHNEVLTCAIFYCFNNFFISHKLIEKRLGIKKLVHY